MVQFFAVMVIVELAWESPYSWADNNISDLGNVTCGEFGGRSVCSPLHDLMNVSFVLGGVLIVGGVLLTSTAWPRGAVAIITRLLLAATGFGWAVAGLWPADVNEDMHVLGGAVIIFLCGNAALLLAGFLRTGTPISRTRWYAAGFGALGLAAMVLHFGGHGLGLGTGGMERVTAYGVPLWLLLTGVFVLRSGGDEVGEVRQRRTGLHSARH
ncbi:putative membrane protein [Kribbella amoyensis]|uniref:Putative membrane protein n=1 Tax=Kribbella amoyensis TaxID=996641 RepID=A0A561BSY6_9ACTN|nr:putative membrane protein [Kribbella amoyensis]